MSTTVTQEPGGAALSQYPRRWLALAIIAVAQLMVVLDATIVNIALPQAQAALGITDADRQWVVTAYTLTFGGLLLLGGRIADYWGRKRTFVVGIVGFALASALGGLAQNGETLFAARGPAGRVRRAARPGRPGPADGAVHRGAGSGPRRSASTARSPAVARRSACCSAACSPSTPTGAGACWSTSRSR